MKSFSDNLIAHLAGKVTSLTACWKITRADTQTFCHTSFDKTLVIDGAPYSPINGTLIRRFDQKLGMNVDNMEFSFQLLDSGITEADIVGALFDGATIDIFLVNFLALADGKINLAKGWTVGNITIKDNNAIGEARAKTQHLQQNIIELYSPTCRAEFGDSRCGLNANSYMVAGAVTSITDRRIFVDSSRSEPTDIFHCGRILWVAGDSAGAFNSGLSMEVESFDPGTRTIVLFLPMPFQIVAGDTYQMWQGCDKKKATCKNTFNNLINFRGEPFIPGPDKLYDYIFPRFD